MKTSNSLRLLAGLLAAPAAWVAQMLLSQPLVTLLCRLQRPAMLTIVLDGLGAACLLLAAAGGWAAWSGWRAERPARHGPGRAVDRGTTPRAFLALLGMMASALFFSAIVFSSLAPLLVAPCTGGP